MVKTAHSHVFLGCMIFFFFLSKSQAGKNQYYTPSAYQNRVQVDHLVKDPTCSGSYQRSGKTAQGDLVEKTTRTYG